MRPVGVRASTNLSLSEIGSLVRVSDRPTCVCEMRSCRHHPTALSACKNSRAEECPMISQEQNDLLTRVGPGTPAGKLMRMYWQPAALAEELAGPRPIRPVHLLGENFVLFRDASGTCGLMDRDCPHRGADL